MMCIGLSDTNTETSLHPNAMTSKQVFSCSVLPLSQKDSKQYCNLLLERKQKLLTVKINNYTIDLKAKLAIYICLFTLLFMKAFKHLTHSCCIRFSTFPSFSHESRKCFSKHCRPSSPNSWIQLQINKKQSQAFKQLLFSSSQKQYLGQYSLINVRWFHRDNWIQEELIIPPFSLQFFLSIKQSCKIRKTVLKLTCASRRLSRAPNLPEWSPCERYSHRLQ